MKEAVKKSNQQIKNKTISLELLESYRGALYKIKEFFESVQEREFDVDNIDDNLKLVTSVLNAGEKLGKNIETLIVLEKKVASEEMDKSKIRGNVKLSLLENDDI